MITNIFEYEKYYGDAIKYANRVLEKIKARVADLDNDDIDLSDTDYNGLIWKLEKSISSLEKLLVRYLFDKMSKEEFDLVIRNKAEGKPTYLITVGQPHKIRSIDTLQLLSVIYEVDPQYILDYNKITAKDFDDKREINAEIKIPIVVDIRNRTNYSDLAVFGSITGKMAWGKDLPNALKVVNGDLKILSNEETLSQGISNRFGFYGDIPGYEGESIDLDWGKDYPPELVELLTIVKISNKLLIDKRIKNVNDVRTQRSGTGLLVDTEITPINSTESIKTKINEKESSDNPLLV